MTSAAGFVHLHVHSPFSFLDGAASIEELVQQAAALGMPALALTDHDNLSGAVRFVQAAEEAGIKPVIGAELTLEGGHHLTVLAASPAGYAGLSRILTEAHLGNERGQPRTSWDSLVRHREDLLFLSGCAKGEIPGLLYRRRWDEAERVARRYAEALGRERFFLELQATELPGQHAVNRALVELAERLGVHTVATGNVHYAVREQHPVHDVLRCIAAGVTVNDPHPARPFNDQLHMIPPEEMARRFAWHPQAVANAAAIAEQCRPALVLGKSRHPRFTLRDEHGREKPVDANALLERLAWDGARRRYGKISHALRRRIEEELAIIRQLDMADYFLVAWDVVQYAKQRGIRSSGRGSAADSVVAYCLGLTNVDAFKRGLSFERFMSVERGEPPDIDIDFEAHRRDEVAAYVFERYGKDRVAGVATYHTYHAKGAIREVGKVLGLPAEDIDFVAKRMPHVPADAIGRALRHYPELRPVAEELARDPLRRRWLELASALAGLPRHLGTHSSGLVISAEPLTDVTPLQMSAKGVPISQFDKDDVEALGLMKLDLLFLRMLAAVNTSTEAVRRRDPAFDYDQIPDGDARTYRRLRRGDTIGAFQLESPAQRALHPRLRPRDFEDIVASVALIRPGPIKGDMVEPFIARRNRLEPVTYVHPKLEPILKKTYGIVLFQEQIIEIARAVAGFTPGEADRLRRAMSSFRSQAEMDRIGQQFIAKAIANGVEPDAARTIFGYIAGYAGYGFCEAHAASFADIAYKTTYLLEHYPAEFYAALLSHQPMGYYPANTLLWEARRRGVGVRGVCVNRSRAEFAVEYGDDAADEAGNEDQAGGGDGAGAGGAAEAGARARAGAAAEAGAENRLATDATTKAASGGGAEARDEAEARHGAKAGDRAEAEDRTEARAETEIATGAEIRAEARTAIGDETKTATRGSTAADAGAAIGVTAGACSNARPSTQSSARPSAQSNARPSAQPSAQLSARLSAWPSTRSSTRTSTRSSTRASVRSSARPSARPSAQPRPFIRVGLRQVRALSQETLHAILEARRDGPFTSLADFCRRVPPLTIEEAEQLVLAGAFDSFSTNRRALLWQLPEALYRGREARERQRRWDLPASGREAAADVNDFPPLERDVREYHALGLTVERHLVHHWRPQLRRRGARTCAEAARLPHGHPVTVGGLTIRPHRPPTKSGRTVVFLTLEDETGLIDVTVFEDVYMRWGEDLFVKPLMLVSGHVEHRGDAVSITARRLEAVS